VAATARTRPPPREDATFTAMSVYVDHAFAVGDWGRWSGRGHMQADTLAELHAFAIRIGMRQEWFQTKPGHGLRTTTTT
jgi:Protein of unknown function (DUF4031)